MRGTRKKSCGVAEDGDSWFPQDHCCYVEPCQVAGLFSRTTNRPSVDSLFWGTSAARGGTARPLSPPASARAPPANVRGGHAAGVGALPPLGCLAAPPPASHQRVATPLEFRIARTEGSEGAAVGRVAAASITDAAPPHAPPSPSPPTGCTPRRLGGHAGGRRRPPRATAAVAAARRGREEKSPSHI